MIHTTVRLIHTTLFTRVRPGFDQRRMLLSIWCCWFFYVVVVAFFFVVRFLVWFSGFSALSATRLSVGSVLIHSHWSLVSEMWRHFLVISLLSLSFNLTNFVAVQSWFFFTSQMKSQKREIMALDDVVFLNASQRVVILVLAQTNKQFFLMVVVLVTWFPSWVFLLSISGTLAGTVLYLRNLVLFDSSDPSRWFSVTSAEPTELMVPVTVPVGGLSLFGIKDPRTEGWGRVGVVGVGGCTLYLAPPPFSKGGGVSDAVNVCVCVCLCVWIKCQGEGNNTCLFSEFLLKTF